MDHRFFAARPGPTRAMALKEWEGTYGYLSQSHQTVDITSAKASCTNYGWFYFPFITPFIIPLNMPIKLLLKSQIVPCKLSIKLLCSQYPPQYPSNSCQLDYKTIILPQNNHFGGRSPRLITEKVGEMNHPTTRTRPMKSPKDDELIDGLSHSSWAFHHPSAGFLPSPVLRFNCLIYTLSIILLVQECLPSTVSWENHLELMIYPPGKLSHRNGKSTLFKGKLSISMIIFNSKLLDYQRVHPIHTPLNHYESN